MTSWFWSSACEKRLRSIVCDAIFQKNLFNVKLESSEMTVLMMKQKTKFESDFDDLERVEDLSLMTKDEHERRIE